MVGIIIHLMCVKSLQLACNQLLTVGTEGSGHLQVNESITSGLESLRPAYTLPDQSLKSLIMAKN